MGGAPAGPSRGPAGPPVGVVWASGTGRTAAAAARVARRLGPGASLVDAAAALPAGDPAGWLGGRFPGGLVVGCPTWATGAPALRTGTPLDDALWRMRQRAEAGEAPLQGVPFAVFGCGHAALWPDNFCDALGEAHATLAACGGVACGAFTPAEDQQYLCSAASRAVAPPAGEGGAGRRTLSFVGLPLDDHSQAALTPGRIDVWCEQLRREFGMEGDGEGLGVGPELSEGGRPAAAAGFGPPPVPGPAAEYGECTLFDRGLGYRHYQLGAQGSLNAGRWVRFGDHALTISAGRRGQPEWRLDYDSIRGAAVEAGAGAGEATVVLAVAPPAAGADGSRPGSARRRWGPELALHDLPAHEVEGLLDFLRVQGAALSG